MPTSSPTQVQPNLDRPSHAKLYTSGEYLQKHPDWHDEDGPWKADQIQRLLRRNDLPCRTVVDVGCGSGRIVRELSERLSQETRFVGYDISPQAITIARKFASERVTFVQDDFLEAETEKADLLLVIDVFEHVEDYLGFLRRLHGRAHHYAFHIPLDLSVLHLLFDRQIWARNASGHLHYFSKATAVRTLADCGYEVLDWFYTAGGLESPPARRHRLKRLLAVPRRALFWLHRDLAVKLLGGYSLLVLAR